MMKIHRQRGSLMIVVVILIVVVSLMATTLTFLVVEDARSAADYLNASNALFVAESGIERGVRQFSINNSYTGEGPTTFGAGTFTINVYTTDIAGAALPITDRRINSKGIVGGAARTINATVRFGGVTLFQDPFPNITQWSTRVSNTIATCAAGNIGLNNTAGTVSYDVDTAAGSSGGSFEIEMIPRNRKRTGSDRVALASSIASGTQVQVSLKYKKIVGARVPDVMMVAIDLISSASNVNRVWSNCTLATTASGWVTVAPFTFQVPAGQTITQVAIAYDLDSSNINPAATFTARIDDLLITNLGSVTFLSWREDTH